MATLLCQSDINFTASSWKTVNSTSFLDSESGSTASTTSYVASQTFTPGAITIEGILLKVRNRIAGATGTFSVEVYNSTAAASVAGTEVTIDAADISTDVAGFEGGWVYFKFSAPVLLLAATLYSVRIKSSVNATVTVYRNATAANWSRGLVTDAAGVAPAASDSLIIAGPHTAAATFTTVTCTHDSTASTAYSTVHVGQDGKHILQNSASTAYRPSIASGTYYVASHNAVCEFGTTSSRVPATSSMLFELVSSGTSANSLFIRGNATFKMAGQEKTRFARAAADFSAGATTITTNISTGWKNTDVIGIGSTARAASPLTESKSLTADASGTTLTISAVTDAKLGTAPVQVPLINLSSNVILQGTSSTNSASIVLSGIAPTFDVDNVLFQYIGGTTGNNRGIQIITSNLSGTSYVRINSCAFNNLQSSCICFYALSTVRAGTYIFNNNVAYRSAVMAIIGTTTGTITNSECNDNTAIGCTSTALRLSEHRHQFMSNVANGGGATGLEFTNTSPTEQTIDDNYSEVNGSTGVEIDAVGLQMTNLTVFRNVGAGISVISARNTALEGATLFGNSSSNISFTSCNVDDLVFGSVVSNAGVTNTCPVGVSTVIASSMFRTYFKNSSFGVTTAHSTSDVVASGYAGELIFVDCNLASTTQVSSQSSLTATGAVKIQKSAGTAGANSVYYRSGKTTTDSAIYDTSPYSIRLTPSSATTKLIVPIGSFNVVSGSVATVTCKVRKSVIGDGAAYNGAQVRWYLCANAAAGSAYDFDILMDTSTAASDGAWETLTYTLPTNVTDATAFKMYFDCDGTAGWINIDTFTVT